MDASRFSGFLSPAASATFSPGLNYFNSYYQTLRRVSSMPFFIGWLLPDSFLCILNDGLKVSKITDDDSQSFHFIFHHSAGCHASVVITFLYPVSPGSANMASYLFNHF